MTLVLKSTNIKVLKYRDADEDIILFITLGKNIQVGIVGLANFLN